MQNLELKVLSLMIIVISNKEKWAGEGPALTSSSGCESKKKVPCKCLWIKRPAPHTAERNIMPRSI